MKAAVVALGKIGLPLAVQIAGSGVEVVGSDINLDVVNTVNAGQPPFPGEPELKERLVSVLEEGVFRATISTPEAVAEADVVVVVVPLIVDANGQPEFSGIDAATEQIGGALRPGTTVVYETTVPIGTTRERFGPILQQASGLKAGGDFRLAFSPERVSSGRVFRDFRTYPKIVGGIDEPSTEAAIVFYEQVLQFEDRPDLARPNGVWDVGSSEAAEFVKLAETTYRDVNIALANEFAEHAEEVGVDFDAVRLAANSQPFSHLHRPGIAVGGHCIPVYPHFYMQGHPSAAIAATARLVNREQPRRAVKRLESEIGALVGLVVVVLGAAYRGGVKESAFSGVFSLVEELRMRGATVRVHDPLFTSGELHDLGVTSHKMGTAVDAAIIQTDHAQYESLSPDDLPGCRVIVDGRRVVRNSAWDRTTTRVVAIGRPGSDMDHGS